MSIRETCVSHSRDGWALSVVEYPRWAYYTARGTAWLIAAAGHPCCGHGLWRWLLPGRAQAALLNNRVVSCDWKHHIRKTRIPITREQAQQVDAEFVESAAWLDGDE